MPQLIRVEIENFRSIRHLAFNPKPLCAIVGPNNAGKSNILSAVEFLLGSRYPTELGLNETSYFYRDESQRLRIKAVLESIEESGPEQRWFEYRFDPDEEGGDGGYRLWGGSGQASTRFVRREARERFPFVRLTVDRAIRQHNPTNRWTLMGRLLLEINREFQQDPARQAQFENTMVELRDNVLGSVPGFVELTSTLRDEAARQLGRRVEDVRAELSLHDPWNFYRTLQLVVQECGIRMPADEMGMGLQSSLVIAILRCYAKIARASRAVIAIEEPELFLHPLAQRQFYRLLRELAYPTDGSPSLQILYTTHSSEFVAVENFDEICVVRRVPDDDQEERWQSTCTQVLMDKVVAKLGEAGINASEKSVRASTRHHTAFGRCEGFFADAVVLVEGSTELLTLPIWAAGCGLS
jgi:putative ATP-dependent endonuclease of OLD family